VGKGIRIWVGTASVEIRITALSVVVAMFWPSCESAHAEPARIARLVWRIHRITFHLISIKKILTVI
jgi:hypothetical protein